MHLAISVVFSVFSHLGTRKKVAPKVLGENLEKNVIIFFGKPQNSYLILMFFSPKT